jgi:hypothetical protein
MFCFTPLRCTGQPHEGGNLAQVVVHQRDVGGFDGGVGAGRAHGKADVGARQRRRIVDAVADHADQTPCPCRSLLQCRQLVFGQQIALGVVDADLLGNGGGGVRVVAGQHQGLDAQACSSAMASRLLSLTVSATANRASTPSSPASPRSCPGFQRIQNGFQSGASRAEFLDQAVVAQ